MRCRSYAQAQSGTCASTNSATSTLRPSSDAALPTLALLIDPLFIDRRLSRYEAAARRAVLDMSGDALGEVEKAVRVVLPLHLCEAAKVGAVVRVLPGREVGIDVVLVSRP
jgi:hypothetical protein